jgi:hypothetical protein
MLLRRKTPGINWKKEMASPFADIESRGEKRETSTKGVGFKTESYLPADAW